MATNIRPEVYKRIVLAKSLHRAGAAACSTRNDQMAFTKGILLLHDAAEAALGAIADHLHVRLLDKHFLLDYYKLIEDADPQKKTVPYRTQMRILNTLRKNAKHQGILPDPQSNAHFPTTVTALLEEICQTYLGLDFSSVSLKSLIKNENVRGYIDLAEEEIGRGDIEEALISLAYAMFQICDAQTMPFLWPLFKKKEEKLYQFTEHFTTEHTVRLLQHGVDPYLYFRFKNITPMIGRHRDTGDLHYHWDKTFGHPANWTIQIARFCLDFCIDIALKFQREEDEGYRLITYDEVYEDIIEPLKDEATIWNQSIHPPKFQYPAPSKPREQLLVLKKGESIVGTTQESVEELSDEWLIISKDIPSEGGRVGIGFVLKNEVNVTMRERQEPKEVDNSIANQQEETKGI